MHYRPLTRVGRPVAELFPAADEIYNYRQLAQHMQGAIRSGLLGVGDLVPSAVEVASFSGLAKSTVHRAIAALAEDGWITRVGKRWSVAPLASAAPDAVAAEQ
jgi:DNA-binding GntR family transcriptional regulator